MKRFIVKRISTYGDSEDDPELKANNIEYPEVVQYVEDEIDTFVIDPETRWFVSAKDFFYEKDISEFEAK